MHEKRGPQSDTPSTSPSFKERLLRVAPLSLGLTAMLGLSPANHSPEKTARSDSPPPVPAQVEDLEGFVDLPDPTKEEARAQVEAASVHVSTIGELQKQLLLSQNITLTALDESSFQQMSEYVIRGREHGIVASVSADGNTSFKFLDEQKLALQPDAILIEDIDCMFDDVFANQPENIKNMVQAGRFTFILPTYLNTKLVNVYIQVTEQNFDATRELLLSGENGRRLFSPVTPAHGAKVLSLISKHADQNTTSFVCTVYTEHTTTAMRQLLTNDLELLVATRSLRQHPTLDERYEADLLLLKDTNPEATVLFFNSAGNEGAKLALLYGDGNIVYVSATDYSTDRGTYRLFSYSNRLDPVYGTILGAQGSLFVMTPGGLEYRFNGTSAAAPNMAVQIVEALQNLSPGQRAEFEAMRQRGIPDPELIRTLMRMYGNAEFEQRLIAHAEINQYYELNASRTAAVLQALGIVAAPNQVFKKVGIHFYGNHISSLEHEEWGINLDKLTEKPGADFSATQTLVMWLFSTSAYALVVEDNAGVVKTFKFDENWWAIEGLINYLQTDEELANKRITLTAGNVSTGEFPVQVIQEKMPLPPPAPTVVPTATPVSKSHLPLVEHRP